MVFMANIVWQGLTRALKGALKAACINDEVSVWMRILWVLQILIREIQILNSIVQAADKSQIKIQQHV